MQEQYFAAQDQNEHSFIIADIARLHAASWAEKVKEQNPLSISRAPTSLLMCPSAAAFLENYGSPTNHFHMRQVEKAFSVVEGRETLAEQGYCHLSAGCGNPKTEWTDEFYVLPLRALMNVQPVTARFVSHVNGGRRTSDIHFSVWAYRRRRCCCLKSASSTEDDKEELWQPYFAFAVRAPARKLGPSRGPCDVPPMVL